MKAIRTQFDANGFSGAVATPTCSSCCCCCCCIGTIVAASIVGSAMVADKPPVAPVAQTPPAPTNGTPPTKAAVPAENVAPPIMPTNQPTAAPPQNVQKRSSLRTLAIMAPISLPIIVSVLGSAFANLWPVSAILGEETYVPVIMAVLISALFIYATIFSKAKLRWPLLNSLFFVILMGLLFTVELILGMVLLLSGGGVIYLMIAVGLIVLASTFRGRFYGGLFSKK